MPEALDNPIIFDAGDVDYLANHFTIEQLRWEIKQARAHQNGEIERDWQDYYEDYIKTCQLAIEIKPAALVKKLVNKNGQMVSPRESIESIKARYDLVDYVGQYVRLRKSGNKFQGLCPFHADKDSASFFVYPDGHWHCFGCQKSGTIIDFVMEYNHLDLKSAIAQLR